MKQVEFTYAHEHWKKRREESLEYLENALKNNQNGVKCEESIKSISINVQLISN